MEDLNAAMTYCGNCGDLVIMDEDNLADNEYLCDECFRLRSGGVRDCMGDYVAC